MARTYANIATMIWRNEDFRALNRDDQHTYLMLVTQADISACGILSVALTRWTNRSSGDTEDRLLTSLRRLHDGRFIAYDEDTQEILVRTFIRWDGGYNNSRRRPAIRDAIRQVESIRLRDVIRRELARLGLPADWLDEALAAAVDVEDDTLFRQPPAETTPPPARTPDGFTDWWEAYPRKVGKKAAETSYAKALKSGVTSATLLQAATRFAAECAEWGRPVDKIPHPTTWLNQGRWDDDPQPVPGNVVALRPTGTEQARPGHSPARGFDAKFAGFQDLANELANQEGHPTP